MNSRSYPIILSLICLTVGLASCTTTSPNSAVEPEYHVTSNRPSAQVTVNDEADSAVVEVYSDNGIGSATIRLISGQWPQSILMHFHLQGLESLQFIYGDTTVNLSITSQNMILESIMNEDGVEEPIDEESAHWMEVTYLDNEGTATDNLAIGSIIEVEAPADFFSEDYSEFTINWIDFYR
jgi:hypothetical protein